MAVTEFDATKTITDAPALEQQRYSLENYRQDISDIFAHFNSLRIGKYIRSYNGVGNYLKDSLLELGNEGVITQPAMLQGITNATKRVLFGGEGDSIAEAARNAINSHDPDRAFRLMFNDNTPARAAWYNADGTPTQRTFLRKISHGRAGMLPVLGIWDLIGVAANIWGARIPVLVPYVAHSTFPRPISRRLAPDRFVRAMHRSIVLEAYQTLPASEKDDYELLSIQSNVPKSLQNALDTTTVSKEEAAKTRLIAAATGMPMGAILGSPVIETIHEKGNETAIVYIGDRLRPNLLTPYPLRRARFTKLLHNR